MYCEVFRKMVYSPFKTLIHGRRVEPDIRLLLRKIEELALDLDRIRIIGNIKNNILISLN